MENKKMVEELRRLAGKLEWNDGVLNTIYEEAQDILDFVRFHSEAQSKEFITNYVADSIKSIINKIEQL